MKDNLSDYERYLKPVHLKGKEVTLTITRFTEEETHPQRGQAKTALVAWFRELPFGLILSPTNRQTLMEAGDSIAGWIGKPITVKSVPIGKVGPVQRSPIRIVNTRPAAPSVNPATGEIVSPSPSQGEGEAPVTYPEQPEHLIVTGLAPEPSELDAHFGTPKITAAENKFLIIDVLPETEAQFGGWLKAHGWNGKEVNAALGTDAKSWLRANPGKSWSDICRMIESAHQNETNKAGQ